MEGLSYVFIILGRKSNSYSFQLLYNQMQHQIQRLYIPLHVWLNLLWKIACSPKNHLCLYSGWTDPKIAKFFKTMLDTMSESHQSQYGFFGDSLSVEKHICQISICLSIYVESIYETEKWLFSNNWLDDIHSPFSAVLLIAWKWTIIWFFSIAVGSLQDFPWHTTKIQKEQNIVWDKYICWIRFKYAGFYLEGKILLELERKWIRPMDFG